MELEKLATIFEAVRVMPLRPSDLLVFRANKDLGLEEKARIYTAIEALTGTQRILILDGGADLAIIRPEAEPEPEAAAEAPAAPPAGAEILPNGQPRRSTVPGGIA